MPCLGLRPNRWCVLSVLLAAFGSRMTASCLRHACFDPLIFDVHQVPGVFGSRCLVSWFYVPGMFVSRYLVCLVPGAWYVRFQVRSMFVFRYLVRLFSSKCPFLCLLLPFRRRSHNPRSTTSCLACWCFHPGRTCTSTPW